MGKEGERERGNEREREKERDASPRSSIFKGRGYGAQSLVILFVMLHHEHVIGEVNDLRHAYEQIVAVVRGFGRVGEVPVWVAHLV